MVIFGTASSEMYLDAVESGSRHTRRSVPATRSVKLTRPDAIARLHNQWIADVVRITGKPPSQVAEEAQIAPATLTKRVRIDPETREIVVKDFEHALSAANIQKIVEAHGVTPPRSNGAREPVRGMAEDAVPFEAADRGPRTRAAVEQLIDGRNAANAWVLQSRALELAGYLPGDVLIVDLNAAPQRGDIVCAQRYDMARPGRTETIFRIYEKPYLVAAGTDPALRRPEYDDGERIVVKGVVTDMIRPRQHVAA